MNRVSELYRSAFVTGASTGLGKAFAGMLVAEGVEVWGTARELSRLSSFTARRTASSTEPALFTAVAMDLRDPLAAESAFTHAAEKAGGFDLVVQNAGFGTFGEFTSVEFSLWREQVEAMLLTTARLSHVALRAMQARSAAQQHGCLVHVSSLAAEFPLPFMSGYNMAKAGLSALSESLHFETERTPISVIDFRPGDYRTPFNQAMQVPQSVAGLSNRESRVWHALERHLQAGPLAVRAAADLRRALLRGRRGVVRSGTFFQATLAPLLARLISRGASRSMTGRYYDL
jgi:uncharacterized protein